MWGVVFVIFDHEKATWVVGDGCVDRNTVLIVATTAAVLYVQPAF